MMRAQERRRRRCWNQRSQRTTLGCQIRTDTQAAASESADMHDGVPAAHSPTHSHQANGGGQKEVRDVKNQLRVMLCALTRRMGAVSTSWPLFDWLVTWSAKLLTRACVGQDGMTACRRLRRRSWEPRLAEFVEQVMARRPKGLGPGRC